MNNPLPTERDILQANEAYHNEVAETYETDISTRTAFGKFSQQRIQEVIELYQKRTKGELFVDLACGTGNVLRYASAVFPRSLGVDISAQMLRKAADRGLDCIRSDVCKLPIKSDSVDMVSCFSALHHFYDLKNFFLEVHRILRKGGILYTDFDPNGRSLRLEENRLYKKLLSFYLWIFSRWFHHSHKQGEHEELARIAEYHWQSSGGFDPEAIKNMLLDMGFADVSVIFHSDCISIHKTRKISPVGKIDLLLKTLFSRKTDYSELARYFILIAEK